MRLSTSALFLSSFALGFMVRPAALPGGAAGEITFTHEKPKALPKSEIIAGRSPASIARAIESSQVEKQTINGVDIVQAMLSKDMASVYGSHLTYESAWRNQFLYSRFAKISEDRRLIIEKDLLRDTPLRPEERERFFRGQASLTVNGKVLKVDVVMTVRHENWQTPSYEAKESKSYQRPCVSIDGFITYDKTVERLRFDQTLTCFRKFLEQNENPYVSVDNYQRPSGAVLSLLLFPANPESQLPIEFLAGGSADWEKGGQSFWKPGTMADQDEMWDNLYDKAMALGVPAQDIQIPSIEW